MSGRMLAADGRVNVAFVIPFPCREVEDPRFSPTSYLHADITYVGTTPFLLPFAKEHLADGPYSAQEAEPRQLFKLFIHYLQKLCVQSVNLPFSLSPLHMDRNTKYLSSYSPVGDVISAQPCKSIHEQNLIFIFHVLIGQVPQSANTSHLSQKTGA